MSKCDYPGTMIDPKRCETRCPSCGCCEHTPASKSCSYPDCSCASIT